MKKPSFLVCTRHFRAELTPEEIHDRLRIPRIKMNGYLYILTDAKPGKLTLSPWRIDRWGGYNTFIGPVCLDIAPTDCGSEITLRLLPRRYLIVFSILWLLFAVLLGLISLLSWLLSPAVSAVQGAWPLIPWLMILFFLIMFTLDQRLTARYLENQLRQILGESKK